MCVKRMQEGGKRESERQRQRMGRAKKEEQIHVISNTCTCSSLSLSIPWRSPPMLLDTRLGREGGAESQGDQL